MNLPLKTRLNACTGNKKRSPRVGVTQLGLVVAVFVVAVASVPDPEPAFSAPQAMSACTCKWRRRSCVQVCSTSVKAAVPPSQRGLAANSVSVAAVSCISMS